MSVGNSNKSVYNQEDSGSKRAGGRGTGSATGKSDVKRNSRTSSRGSARTSSNPSRARTSSRASSNSSRSFSRASSGSSRTSSNPSRGSSRGSSAGSRSTSRATTSRTVSRTGKRYTGGTARVSKTGTSLDGKNKRRTSRTPKDESYNRSVRRQSNSQSEKGNISGSYENKKPIKQQIKKHGKNIYARRRLLVVLFMFLLGIAVVFIAFQGFSYVQRVLSNSSYAQNSSTQEENVSVVYQNCTKSDVDIKLSANSDAVTVGNSIKFTETLSQKGETACLVNADDLNEVLNIYKGSDTSGTPVFSSANCGGDSRQLLMAKGDEDVRTYIWKTQKSTSSGCEVNSNLVSTGNYTAVLVLKLPDSTGEVTSNEVKFSVTAVQKESTSKKSTSKKSTDKNSTDKKSTDKKSN